MGSLILHSFTLNVKRLYISLYAVYPSVFKREISLEFWALCTANFFLSGTHQTNVKWTTSRQLIEIDSNSLRSVTAGEGERNLLGAGGS